MRLALVGDIHAYRLWVAPWRLWGKRFLGQMNLWLNRRHRFDLSLLKPTLVKACAIKPELMLFTGDLTTSSLEDEFGDVLKLMQETTGDVPKLILPGNHDRYTREAARNRTIETLVTRHLPGALPARFPHYQSLIHGWHLLALDAAIPRNMDACGLLGHEQLKLSRELIAPLTSQDGLLVMCHFPIIQPPELADRLSHRLLDRQTLREMLAGCPARTLFLHGHVHQTWTYRPSEPDLRLLLDVNAGSPTRISARTPYGQGFWQIDLPDDPCAAMRLTHHRMIRKPEPGPEAWEANVMTMAR